VSLMEDGFGRCIGETLHETVRPADWWLQKFASVWKCGSWFDRIGAGPHPEGKQTHLAVVVHSPQ